MTDNLKKSIIKANLDMGRPKAEDKREVRRRWTLKAADCLEEHRDWIERNIELIAKWSNELKEVDEYQRSDHAKELRVARKKVDTLFDEAKRGGG